MSRAIRISFGPCDPLNPECGYEFMVESRKGVEMHTGNHPDTGEPLTAEDCIALAQKFHELGTEEGPEPGSLEEAEAYRDQPNDDLHALGEDYEAGRDAGVEAAALLVEKNWIDHGVLRPVPSGSLDCTTRGGYAAAIRKLTTDRRS